MQETTLSSTNESREAVAIAAEKLLNLYRNYATSMYAVLRTTQQHGEEMKTNELERAMVGTGMEGCCWASQHFTVSIAVSLGVLP